MDDPDMRDLLGHLFSLITAKLEDAAALAADGQAADLERIQRLAAAIGRLIEDARALLGAIEVL